MVSSGGDGSDRRERTPHLGGFGLLIALILCCLIVGGLTYSAGIEGERRDQYPAAYSDTAKQSAQRTCVGTEPGAVFDCVYEKVEASQDQARAEQDLDAQQGMKFWAAIMAIFTLATVLITAVGVWFVKRTLDATLEAVEDTGRATDAMLAGNEIAQKSAEKQLRAYLSVKSITISDDREIGGLGYGVILINNGVTPAHMKGFKIDIIWLAKEHTKIVVSEKNDLEFTIHRDTPTNLSFNSDANFAEEGVEGDFFVQGQISYNDEFGSRYSEDFNFRTSQHATLFDFDLPQSMSAFSQSILNGKDKADAKSEKSNK